MLVFPFGAVGGDTHQRGTARTPTKQYGSGETSAAGDVQRRMGKVWGGRGAGAAGERTRQPVGEVMARFFRDIMAKPHFDADGSTTVSPLKYCR